MKKPIRLLYLENSDVDARVFFHTVEAERLPYEVRSVKTLAQARAQLNGARFDLVVTECHLPDGYCMDLLTEVKGIPLIVLTGPSQEAWALLALEHGADDYLLKESEGRHLEALPVAIDKALRRQRLHDTERRLTEELHQSEELRRLAEEAGGVGSFDFDSQTGKARVSPELLAIYGEQPNSVRPVLEVWRQYVHPDDRGKIDAIFQGFRPNGVPWSCEFRIVRPDGEVRWIETRARTIFDSQGRPARIIGVNVDITDRKRTQEALRDSEDFYRTLIETLPVLVVLADAQGKVTYVSPAGSAMFGLKPGEGLGTVPTDWIAPEHHDVVRQRMRKVMVELQAQPPIEYKMRRPDGKAIWASLASAPLLDTHGRLKGVITVCENITDRKRAQQAVADSEERLRMVLQASTTGWWHWDLTTGQVTADTQAKALFGLPPDAEVSLDVFLKVLDPVDVQRVLEELPSALAATGDFDSEFHLIWPDGTSHWVQAKGQAFRDESGQAQRLMGLVIDVTARKRAEDQLRRTAERLELLSTVASRLLASDQPEELIDDLCQKVMQHIGCDVFFNYLVVGEGQRKLRLNRAAGISPDVANRIEQLNFGDALCGFAAQARRPVIVANISESTDPRTELMQSLGITAYACHPLLSRGNLIGTLSFASRNSPTFAEDELALMRAVSDQVAVALERMRLLALAHQHAAEADAANRAKDHFLAVLSHELRTPLTPVVMGVSMLQDKPELGSSARETLEMVRRNVELEARLIDDLLDVTRIARGKIELHRGPIELCTVIHRAVEVCQPDIEARHLEFGVDLGPSAPYWVMADAARLQQVFWNLLKNAIKFTPHGGCVGVRCRPVNGCVEIEVSDSGIGIEPEALRRVFDAFEQTEQSITRQFGGLGLGLAISKALVEMHGGKIEAHSEGRDKGATFRIQLPLTAPSSPRQPTRLASLRGSADRPLRILLVEDHGVTAKMMHMVLTLDGHIVETAGDVATALEKVSHQDFDLLMSDLGLPDGSGHDLMRQLRERGHKLPGIALSGYGQEEDIQRSLEVGFAAHLTKPASREAIVEAVVTVTSGEPRATETTTGP